jgi:hypothetical protein
MTLKSGILTASILAVLVAASPSIAGNVEVGGNLVNVSVVGNATNKASGIGSRATQSIGTVGDNVKVGGSVKNVVVVGEAVNLAKGIGSKAKTYVGALRNINTPGSIKQTIVVRKVVNKASGFLGFGGNSCVSIGYGNHC